ncbi:MAG: DUF5683 domain-containing protein [Spirochaetota bacterium]
MFVKFIIPILLLFSPLYADIVVLKNGDILDNVKATIKTKYILIQAKQGKARRYRRDLIKNIKFKPVIWKVGQKQPDYSELLRVVKEQNSFNELLNERLKKLESGVSGVEKNVTGVKKDVTGVKGDIDKLKSEQTNWGNVARSAVLPGWGQWNNGNVLRGTLYCLLFVGSAAATYAKVWKMRQTQKKFNEFNNPFVIFLNTSDMVEYYFLRDQYFSPIEKEINRNRDAANFYSGLMVLTWTISVFDAMFSNSKLPQKKRSKTSWHLQIDPFTSRLAGTQDNKYKFFWTGRF